MDIFGLAEKILAYVFDMRSLAEKTTTYVWDGLQSIAKQMTYLLDLALIHISEPTRPRLISYAVFCLKKKKNHLPQLIEP